MIVEIGKLDDLYPNLYPRMVEEINSLDTTIVEDEYYEQLRKSLNEYASAPITNSKEHNHSYLKTNYSIVFDWISDYCLSDARIEDSDDILLDIDNLVGLDKLKEPDIIEGSLDEDCLFCSKILDGRCAFIDGGKVAYFKPQEPVVDGHMIFVPTVHATHRMRGGVGSISMEQVIYYTHRYATKQKSDFELNISCVASIPKEYEHIHVHYIPFDANYNNYI